MNNPAANLTNPNTPASPALIPLTSGEVARRFGVTTTTVKRWADRGVLAFFRTPGGHYRFRADEVERLAADGSPAAGAA